MRYVNPADGAINVFSPPEAMHRLAHLQADGHRPFHGRECQMDQQNVNRDSKSATVRSISPMIQLFS